MQAEARVLSGSSASSGTGSVAVTATGPLGTTAGTCPEGKARPGAAGRGGVGWRFRCRRGGYLGGGFTVRVSGNFFYYVKCFLNKK